MAAKDWEVMLYCLEYSVTYYVHIWCLLGEYILWDFGNIVVAMEIIAGSNLLLIFVVGVEIDRHSLHSKHNQNRIKLPFIISSANNFCELVSGLLTILLWRRSSQFVHKSTFDTLVHVPVLFNVHDLVAQDRYFISNS